MKTWISLAIFLTLTLGVWAQRSSIQEVADFNSPEVPEAVGAVDSTEIAESLYFNKKTVINGKIDVIGKTSGTVYLVKEDIATGESNKDFTQIGNDGKFELNFELDHPLWTYLSYDKYGKEKIASVYIRPGDELRIDVDADGCSYSNKSGRPTYEKLMKYYPGTSVSIWVDSLVDKMTRKEFAEMLSEKEQADNRTADFICQKHSFSPWETYLYKQQIKLVYSAYLLRYNVVLDANRNRKENAHLNTEPSDYSFLSRLNPNDISYCSLSFYYPILCQMQNIEEFSKIRSWGLQNLNYGEGMETGIKIKQNDWINEKAGWGNGLSYLMQGAMVVGMKNRIQSNNEENTIKENEKLLQLFTHPYFRNKANRIEKYEN